MRCFETQWLYLIIIFCNIFYGTRQWLFLICKFRHIDRIILKILGELFYLCVLQLILFVLKFSLTQQTYIWVWLEDLCDTKVCRTRCDKKICYEELID